MSSAASRGESYRVLAASGNSISSAWASVPFETVATRLTLQVGGDSVRPLRGHLMSTKMRAFVVVLGVSLSIATGIAGQNYVPDTKYSGPTLAGWHVIGSASWRVE